MPLTLKIISPTNLPGGQLSEYKFDELGGSIGRKPSNDFILIDPERFISSNHANIDCRQGKYFITDVSTNGVFINDNKQPLGLNNSAEISNGDKIIIGDFQILAECAAQAAAPSASPWDQPGINQAASPAMSPMNPVGAASSQDPFADIMQPVTAGGGDDIVDPLALLGGDTPGAAAPMSQPQPMTADSPLTNGFSGSPDTSGFNSSIPADPMGIENITEGGADPLDNLFNNPHENIPEPSPINEPFTPPDSIIPDDWDIMSDSAEPINNTAAPLSASNTPQPAIPADAPLGIEDDIFSALEADAAVSSPQTKSAPPMAPAPTPPTIDPVEQLLQQQPAQAPHVQAPVAAPIPPAQTPAAPSATDGDELLNAFLQGAGMAGTSISAADKKLLMQKIGMLTRINTEGLMIALRARATIKSSFRVNKTTIAPTENNPLKFLVTADDALSTLLSDDKPGYMSAIEAVNEGYADLQNHQMAMMAGLQATVKTIVEQFNPQTLERRFENQSHSGSLIPGSKKSRNWDCYSEFFNKLSERLTDDFQNVYGEEFANAYENQEKKLT